MHEKESEIYEIYDWNLRVSFWNLKRVLLYLTNIDRCSGLYAIAATVSTSCGFNLFHINRRFATVT